MAKITFTRHDESCEVEISYRIIGSYRSATMEEPEEHPELDWWVEGDDTIEFTGKEILDFEQDCWADAESDREDFLTQKAIRNYESRNDL